MIEGNIEKDFWEQNPSVKYRSPFNKLYEKAPRKASSKLMWAIYLLEDPKSDYVNMQYSHRKVQIEKIFLKGKVKLDKYEKFCEAYKTMLMTKEELLFNMIEQKLEQYVIAVSDVNMDNVSGRKEVRMSIKDIEGMFKSFKRIQSDMLSKRKIHKQMKGKNIMSSREAKIISRVDSKKTG